MYSSNHFLHPMTAFSCIICLMQLKKNLLSTWFSRTSYYFVVEGTVTAVDVTSFLKLYSTCWVCWNDQFTPLSPLSQFKIFFLLYPKHLGLWQCKLFNKYLLNEWMMRSWCKQWDTCNRNVAKNLDFIWWKWVFFTNVFTATRLLLVNSNLSFR